MIASFLFESLSHAGNGALLASIPASKAMYLEYFFIIYVLSTFAFQPTQLPLTTLPSVLVTYHSVEDEPLEW